MGYGVIPIVASIALVLHHAILTDASRWSKGDRRVNEFTRSSGC